MDVARWLRRFRAAVWLTWKEQSNWTRPYIYILYSMITPFFSVLIYAYIYVVIAFFSGLVDYSRAFYLVSGVALYNFIGSGLYGLIWTIHSEREHFRTLKYTYLAFPSLHLYLMARSFFHFILGGIYAVVMFIAGLLITGYPLETLNPNIVEVLLLLIIGYLWSSQLGVMVAGTSIFSSEYGPLISEAVGGILFLVGAVLYPVSALPPFIQPIASVFPMMEWMELMRHSLNQSYIITNIGDMYLSLIVKTVIYILLSIVYFSIIERLTRKRGYLEATLHH